MNPYYTFKKEKRHKCRHCGAIKFAKFMKKVNDWHKGQWECKNKFKCSFRKANYGT